MLPALESPSDLLEGLAANGYLADENFATVLYLAIKMGRPLLLEGEAGVGKTETAKVLSRLTSGELIRLQCYDGIDVSQAVYEWDYSRQLLHLRASEAAGRGVAPGDGGDERRLEADIYSERFLVKRPLLRAIAGAGGAGTAGPVPVLLVDEIDRADDEFEAYLLELLSDYAVTVPELGTFRADRPPLVVITSNRTRDVHDALKRRCLYHWVDHPPLDREVSIVRLRVPGATESLARQVATAAGHLRAMGLYKPPGVAETIDWATALVVLGEVELTAEVVARTLGAVVKYREDAERVRSTSLGSLASSV